MAKQAPINFDDISLKILKDVDSIHRDSLVNVALALVSKTGYYRTLTGALPENLEEVTSLDALDDIDIKETKTAKKEQPKSDVDWGSDFF